MSKHLFFSSVIALSALFSSANVQAAAATTAAAPEAATQTNELDEAQKQASAISAQAWLNQTDAGQYQQAWESSSQVLQWTMPVNEWVKLMTAVRRPLGQVISRNVLEQLPAENPKGLPAGSYMVIYYKTSFQNRQDAKELITLFLGYDGQWRVLTYNVS